MSFHKQHILVTGGAGFIGSHVVEALVHLDARVTVADRFAPDRDNPLQPLEHAIRTINMDVGHEAFSSFLQDEAFDVILHLAGPASVPLSVEDPYQNFQDSLHNTIRLLEVHR